MFNSLAQYPHWFVVACAVLAAAVLWVLLKLLKAALWILFFGLLARRRPSPRLDFLQLGRRALPV
jgi:type VI protein secretion system component VasF